MALFISRFANRLAEKVTIYTNANPVATAAIQEALSKLKPTSKTAQNVTVDSRKIARFVKGTQKAEVEVHFEDGASKTEGFLSHAPKFTLNGGWVEMLGLETTEMGHIKASPPLSETSVGGVFAAGDCVLMQASVITGVASAVPVAVGLCSQLEAED